MGLPDAATTGTLCVPMNLAIVGSGYVGLVTGTCFAEMGNDVICVDVDPGKIERLRRHETPIYEPGLQELLEENGKGGRLKFTTVASEALGGAELAFICVGTPMSDNGEADLRYVESAARAIGKFIEGHCVVVNKSTVPVGTADRVRSWIGEEVAARKVDLPFEVASNPEFLKEGSAVDDFMKPDRVVVGVDDPRAEALLRDLYAPFIRNGLRFYTMDIRSAEMTKYAANCMLATKISFINEIANVCEETGANVLEVAKGVGLDQRIGPKFLSAGIGYGGSCFTKDVSALKLLAANSGYHFQLLGSVIEVNELQKRRVVSKLTRRLESLAGKRIGLLGLAFKPNTDDMRGASSLVLAARLTAEGATVRAFDPIATEEARKIMPELDCMGSVEDVIAGADAIVLVTEWPQFLALDWEAVAASMSGKVVIDGRNALDAAAVRAAGLEYEGIGIG